MPTTTGTVLQLPLTLKARPYVGRHERLHISDATGVQIAFCDYTTGPDPEGISGEAAFLLRLPTSAGFAAWDALCDALGVTDRSPGRFLGEIEVRGADGITRTLDALQALTAES